MSWSDVAVRRLRPSAPGRANCESPKFCPGFRRGYGQGGRLGGTGRSRRVYGRRLPQCIAWRWWVKSPLVPAEPPTLLPGPTAYDLVRRQTLWLIAAVLVLPFIGLGSLLSQPMRGIVIVAFLVLGLVCAVRSGRAAISEMRSEGRERAAGYTTLLRSRRYRNLWRLDPRTGSVVRRPGETP
jgi:hypothetical protein